jgi:hypothetical protein
MLCTVDRSREFDALTRALLADDPSAWTRLSLKPNISAHAAVLRSALEADGWEVLEIEEPDPWWCHELWRMRSVWAPRECEAFITFLIDPQSETEQLQRGTYRVWAAVASASPLSEWRAAPSEATITTSHGWASQVPTLVEYLAKMRANRVSERAQGGL